MGTSFKRYNPAVENLKAIIVNYEAALADKRELARKLQTQIRELAASRKTALEEEVSTTFASLAKRPEHAHYRDFMADSTIRAVYDDYELYTPWWPSWLNWLFADDRDEKFQSKLEQVQVKASAYLSRRGHPTKRFNDKNLDEGLVKAMRDISRLEEMIKKHNSLITVLESGVPLTQKQTRAIDKTVTRTTVRRTTTTTSSGTDSYYYFDDDSYDDTLESLTTLLASMATVVNQPRYVDQPVLVSGGGGDYAGGGASGGWADQSLVSDRPLDQPAQAAAPIATDDSLGSFS